jgi:hypothetical protein
VVTKTSVDPLLERGTRGFGFEGVKLSQTSGKVNDLAETGANQGGK